MAKGKLGLSFLTCLLILSASLTANAAMIGGLAAPLGESEASISIVLAYSERDVKNGVKDEASSRRFLFKGAYGLGNGADVYAFAGLSDISYKSSKGARMDGSLGESIGAGLRYSPVEFADGTRLVLDFQGDWISSDEGSAKADYTMFRAAVYAVGKFGSSGKFGAVYPYGGLAVSTAEFDNNRYDDYKGDGNVGLIAGSDFYINPNVFLTLEFHLFDESAAYLSAGYRF